MKTVLEKITEYDKRESRDIIEAAGKIIREGGLVAFPTETVYGLGADALNPDASKKIYQAKGRPSDNPLIVHICCMEDLERITAYIPEKARKMAKAFWPGPLTMIFEKSKAVPLETTGGLATVAVRMPSHPAALALIRAGEKGDLLSQVPFCIYHYREIITSFCIASGISWESIDILSTKFTL